MSRYALRQSWASRACPAAALVAAALAFLALLWPMPARAQRAGNGRAARAVVTTTDRARLLAPLPVSRGDASSGEPGARSSRVIVTVQLDTRLQPMRGVGAALTDASVRLIGRLEPAARQALLRDLFSPRTGAGLSMIRVPIGASDFSERHYTLADVPPGARDTAMRAFRFEGERERLQLIRDIRALQPRLTVMATPWSAPAWMKTPETLYGGTLTDDAIPFFARYLERVVQAWDSAGVPLSLLSVQNEPQHAPTDYPGMRLSARQRTALIAEHLGPRLAARARAPQLLEWDHNWDAPEEPLAVLANDHARGFVHGVAWHCYAGDVQAQARVHDAHPEIATYFTECAGGAWAPNFGDNLLWNAATLLVGTTRAWARGVMLWNVALDSAGGPHLGGCGDCRGVVTIDGRTGRVTRNEEYYALAHVGKFVQHGAVRVASEHSLMSAAIDSNSVAQVAFVNPDRSVAVLLVNRHRADIRAALHFSQRAGSRGAVTVRRISVLLPGRSVVTVVVPPQ